MQNNKNDDALEISLCPSFSAYFSDRQAAASRVVNETSAYPPPPQSELEENRFGFAAQRSENHHCDADDEFEFEIPFNDSFPEPEVGEIFPFFNHRATPTNSTPSSVSLAKLFVTQKRNSPSSNEKSKSTGSMTCSKRWRLRDLFLRRSNSDGNKKKSSLVFSAPSPTDGVAKVKNVSKEWKYESNKTTASAHELFYVKNRSVKVKRKSYLPYKSGLFGFCLFSEGMRLNTNFHSF